MVSPIADVVLKLSENSVVRQGEPFARRRRWGSAWRRTGLVRRHPVRGRRIPTSYDDATLYRVASSTKTQDAAILQLRDEGLLHMTQPLCTCPSCAERQANSAIFGQSPFDGSSRMSRAS